MHKTIAETRAYCRRLAAVSFPETVRVFLLPPLTALAAAREEIPADCPVLLGAQNAHWADRGPWTGEVSMQMVRDAGASLVEIGHSERREHFGETNETAALKVRAAFKHGLTPLLCVGEPLSVREAGNAEEHVLRQLDAAVVQLPASRTAGLLVAYEPVWAIGARGTAATPDLIAPVIAALSDRLAELTRGVGCQALLYGGSVDQGNAPELLRIPRLDGLFVGRAAWHAGGFLRLVDIAARREDLLRDDASAPAVRHRLDRPKPHAGAVACRSTAWARRVHAKLLDVGGPTLIAKPPRLLGSRPPWLRRGLVKFTAMLAKLPAFVHNRVLEAQARFRDQER